MPRSQLINGELSEAAASSVSGIRGILQLGLYYLHLPRFVVMCVANIT